MKFIREKSFCQ